MTDDFTILEAIDHVADQFEQHWGTPEARSIEAELQANPTLPEPQLLRELLLVELECRRRQGDQPNVDEYLERFAGHQEIVRSAFESADYKGIESRSTREAQRSALFGLLALKNDLITEDQLFAAFQLWIQDKSQSIAEILIVHGALKASDRELLQPLLERHLENHGGLVSRCFEELSSLGAFADRIQALGDAQLDATIQLTGARNFTSVKGAEVANSRSVGERSSVGRTETESTRYRILRTHAKGGLGEVSVAKDAELNREVAVKEIQRQYANDQECQSRFLLEAEITGGLEHPGIVPIYGLGRFDDGRPFYAMRFIKGDSLKESADAFHEAHAARKPDRTSPYESIEFRKLLTRFLDVCNAIEYAHSRGVLHRDLKPGNIMLGKYGETLVVDWGLAKVKGRDGQDLVDDEGTLRPQSNGDSTPTQMGSALGTPAFMPPEQAAGRLLELGPQSDVYSLGATLYYLLTGKAPVQGKQLDEVLDQVKRGQIQPPRELDARIPKPLEAIALRAMALCATDRYASPQELADDVECYLADQPTTALKEPLHVQARRWMRQHPGPTSALAATILVGLVSVTVISVLLGMKNQELEVANSSLDLANGQLQEKNTLLIEARREAETKAEEALESREKERIARQDAESVIEFFQDRVLTAARPKDGRGGLGIGATIRQAIDAAEPEIEKSFADRPLVEAKIRGTLGTTYRSLGDLDLAVRQHELARDLCDENLLDDDPERYKATESLAVSYLGLGRYKDAGPLLRETLVFRERVLGMDHEDTIRTLHNFGGYLSEVGEISGAISALRSAVDRSKTVHGDSHEIPLDMISSLGIGLQQSGRVSAAIELFEDALKTARSSLGFEHPTTLMIANNLSAAYLELRYVDKAIPLIEGTLQSQLELLGADHPDRLTSLSNLAAAYHAKEMYDEAVALYLEAIQLMKTKIGADHPDTLLQMNNLAVLYQEKNELDEALAIFEEAHQAVLGKVKPSHPSALLMQINIAFVKRALGRLDEAIVEYETVERLAREEWGAGHFKVASVTEELAKTYQKAGRTEDAIALCQAYIAACQQRYDEGDGAGQYMVQIRLASIYLDVNRNEEAAELIGDFVSKFRVKVGADEKIWASVLEEQSEELIEHEQFAVAEPYLRESLEIRTRIAPNDWTTFHAMSRLGQVIAGQASELSEAGREGGEKKMVEAESLLLEGFEGMTQRESLIPDQSKNLVVESLQQLVSFYQEWNRPAEEAKWRKELESRQ